MINMRFHLPSPSPQNLPQYTKYRPSPPSAQQKTLQSALRRPLESNQSFTQRSPTAPLEFPGFPTECPWRTSESIQHASGLPWGSPRMLLEHTFSLRPRTLRVLLESPAVQPACYWSFPRCTKDFHKNYTLNTPKPSRSPNHICKKNDCSGVS